MKSYSLIIFFSCLNISLYTQSNYRDYENNASDTVKKFYYENRRYQTLDFVIHKKREYIGNPRIKMGIWQAMEALDTIVDESDPDLDQAQSVHAFQTAERLLKDGQPRWLILTGLIHDLGKILILFGEPQWAVVGDTFPVGCAFSDKLIFYHNLKENPDINNELYQNLYGIYSPHCGLENVHMSWGHDEYLYHIVKNYLPEEALYIIRYHSFYAAFKENAYEYLLNDYDVSMMKWLQLFNGYDLYSKSSDPVHIEELMPYYKELVAEFFPEDIWW